MVRCLFTPVTLLIRQYIKGLLAVIKDTVEGSKPATLEESMRLAGQLTKNRVKSKDLKRKGDQGSSDKASAEKPKEVKETNTESSSCVDTKRKHDGKNYVVASTTCWDLTLQEEQIMKAKTGAHQWTHNKQQFTLCFPLECGSNI
ncbi:hypothetical protein HanIR_Chr02g0066401 [Helianthus annuus]|nr:hypothetical protein HanIR_Chr02g0066401 [Helianthus annuus]